MLAPSHTFLRTRVARRVLLLFMVCAVLPIGSLAIVSYLHVRGQLSEQSRTRLRDSSKVIALTVLERLQFASLNLGQVGKRAADGVDATAATLDLTLFSAVTLEKKGGLVLPLVGDLRRVPPLTEIQLEHLAQGRPLLTRNPGSTGSDQIILVERLVSESQGDRIWGVLRKEHVLGAEDDVLPNGMSICVLDSSKEPVYCPGNAGGRVLAATEPDPSGELTWRSGNETYLAWTRHAYLNFEYGAAGWLLVVSEPRERVLAPLADFERAFLPVVVLALMVVFTLSNVQIRRSLVPLEELREGTRRIAELDFRTPVIVQSKDEFQDLAQSFNGMALRLDRDFVALTAINQIDRAVLSVGSGDEVLEAILRHSREVLACDGVSLCVQENDLSGTWKLWVASEESDAVRVEQRIMLSPAEREELQRNQCLLRLTSDDSPRSYAPAHLLAGLAARGLLALPLYRHGTLVGVIVAAYQQRQELSDEILAAARLFADRIAVALSHTHLIQELDQLSWDTIVALARTIDASSPWTAGHSERVTGFALEIGRELGLDAVLMSTLHRGGLLHDIGKIGIPSTILDKNGPLDTEERLRIQEHPVIGASILAPIGALAPAIPIVRHHHEAFDGSGYPDRLACEAIPFLARVLTVADVFDALVSDRPYRAGWSRSDAIDHITKRAGVQFDPGIVPAFLRVMTRSSGLEDFLPLAEQPSGPRRARAVA
jgi:putative nucleotidyltransferase with HDIG domain